MNEGSVLEHASGALAGRPLARMNGIGNAIVVLDLRGSDAVVSAAEARAIAAAPGLGFDQLMVIHDPREPGTDAFVAIYNTDGSPSGACGNGTRCVAWFMLRGATRDTLVLTTATARLECRRLDPWRFSVDMGRPSFDPAAIPLRADVADPSAVDLGIETPFGRPFAVGMGNPHAVFFVPDADAVDLPRFGRPVEIARSFPNAPTSPLRRSSTAAASSCGSGSAAPARRSAAAPAPAPRWSPRPPLAARTAAPASTCRAARSRSPGATTTMSS